MIFVSFFFSIFSVSLQGQKIINLDTIGNTVYLGKFKLKTPSFFSTKYTYDPLIDKYIYTTKAGEIDVGIPLVLEPDEYRKIIREISIKKYFKEKIKLLADEDSEDSEKIKNLLPDLYLNSNFFESIFGGDEIELNPQGSISMDIGARYQKRDNPSLSTRNQSNVSLDFNQAISLSLNGKVGKRLTIASNYDTQSTFDFQNLLKLDYTPTEDDIIQKIELGNVSMPISGSLINGAQSLFGFKTQLKFGATTIDAVISEQRSQSSTVSANSDGAFNEFSFFPLDYDSNRHFFLAHYFRKNFDIFLETSPYVNSPIKITRIEIWITNQSNETDNVRSIVALQDIGESDPNFTRIDDFANNFFNSSSPDLPPNNSLNGFSSELGSFAILLSVSDGDLLGAIGFDAKDGNAPSRATEASAGIAAFAAEDHSTGDKGGDLAFFTSPIDQDDDTASVERMRITSEGKVIIGDTPNFTSQHDSISKFTIQGTDAGMLIEKHDDSASGGPTLSLYRYSASEADGDLIGQINFRGEGSTGNPSTYMAIRTEIEDTTEGTKDGSLIIRGLVNNSQTDFAEINSAGLTLNQGAYNTGNVSKDANTVSGSSLADGSSVTLFTVPATTRGFKATIFFKDTSNTEYQIEEIMGYNTGSGVDFTSFGQVFSGAAAIGSLDATDSSGTTLIKFTNGQGGAINYQATISVTHMDLS